METIRERRSVELEWDELVRSSGDGWFTHLYDYQETVCQAWGLRDCSLALRDDKGLLALLPLQLRVQRGRFIKWRSLQSNAMGPCGPVLRDGLSARQRSDVFRLLRQELDVVAAETGADECWIQLSPLAPNRLPDRQVIVNPLEDLRCETVQTQSYVVDLTADEEQLWKGLEGRARNAIRKAEREGYEITLAGSDADADAYYALHAATYQRTGATPHPPAFFQNIWNRLGPPGVANLFMARFEGEAVAAVNVGAFKGAAVYWTGASLEEHARNGVNNLLLWKTILWARNQGIRWYEVGEALPDAGDPKLRGLTRFKRSFGGQLVPYFKGRILFHRSKALVRDTAHLLKRRLRGEAPAKA